LVKGSVNGLLKKGIDDLAAPLMSLDIMRLDFILRAVNEISDKSINSYRSQNCDHMDVILSVAFHLISGGASPTGSCDNVFV
jgi:hypothetical protein